MCTLSFSFYCDMNDVVYEGYKRLVMSYFDIFCFETELKPQFISFVVFRNQLFLKIIPTIAYFSERTKTHGRILYNISIDAKQQDV